DDPATRQLRVEEIETGNVQVLPQIEQHEVEGAWQRFERVLCRPEPEVDLRGQARLAQARAGVFDLARMNFQRGHPTTHFVGGLGQPQGRIAVRGADFQNAAALAFPDEQVHEGAAVGPDSKQQIIYRVLTDTRSELTELRLLRLGARLVLSEDFCNSLMHRP